MFGCGISPSPQPLSKEDLLHLSCWLVMVLVVGSCAPLTFGIIVPMNSLIVQAASNGTAPSLPQSVIPIFNTAKVREPTPLSP